MVLSVSAYLIGFGFLAFVINLAVSASRGREVSGDPWPVVDSADVPTGAPAPSPAE